MNRFKEHAIKRFVISNTIAFLTEKKLLGAFFSGIHKQFEGRQPLKHLFDRVSTDCTDSYVRYDAINIAFTWGGTKEGHAFWKSIQAYHKKYMDSKLEKRTDIEPYVAFMFYSL